MSTSRLGEPTRFNRVYLQDCVQGMRTRLSDETVDVIVTSPPYNIDKEYGIYNDSRPWNDYLDWIEDVAKESHRVLSPVGSFFLNVGSRPSRPWTPFEVAERFRRHFVLQNVILWVKSIAITTDVLGDHAGTDASFLFGHYKPVNSQRYLNGLCEYVFHFTKRGEVPLEKLAVGVPYKDKSNVSRWKSAAGGVRDRGNVWYIPYDTIWESRAHPCVFPPKLPEMCIRLHGVKRTRLVLDPFMGTGSTALACLDLGIPYVGFEIDPRYVALTRKATSQRKLEGAHQGRRALEPLIRESPQDG